MLAAVNVNNLNMYTLALCFEKVWVITSLVDHDCTSFTAPGYMHACTPQQNGGKEARAQHTTHSGSRPYTSMITHAIAHVFPLSLSLKQSAMHVAATASDPCTYTFCVGPAELLAVVTGGAFLALLTDATDGNFCGKAIGAPRTETNLFGVSAAPWPSPSMTLGPVASAPVPAPGRCSNQPSVPTGLTFVRVTGTAVESNNNIPMAKPGTRRFDQVRATTSLLD